MSEIKADTTEIDNALVKVLATSKRDASVVMEEVMRGVVRHLIGITPPAFRYQNKDGAWNEAMGGKARTHGRALVRGDIKSVYGTPRQLYKEIQEKDRKAATAFWRHRKQGEPEKAQAIARQVVGKGIYAFDGGKAHQNLKKGRARGRSRRPLFFIEDPKPLEAYIRETQERVGWLVAGWNEAAAQLRVEPPGWIWKHAAPGSMLLEIGEDRVRIVATNAVKFASGIADMQRRVQWALDSQAAAMMRQYEDYLAKNFADAGFAVVVT